MDNTTAVAYVNNQGGAVSRELVRLSKELWTWCLQRNITVKAQHLPGRLNQVADSESRTMLDRSDWKLDSRVFQQIHQLWGPMEVDLFASRLTTQCPVFFSWRPDPYAAATDAFLQVWTGLKAYANPPWNLVGRVAAQAQAEQASLVLVAPVWRTQPWYPILLEMLVDAPHLIPPETSNKSLTDENPSASRLAHIREKCRDHKLSEEASSLIFGSWRKKTNKSYNSLFGRWHSWCSRRGTNPFSIDIANFLAELFTEGYKYNSLNAYRSAISSVHEKVEGYEVGHHPLITRLIKGVFNTRPPLPKYTSTWNVQTVLDHITSMGANNGLSLKELTLKTVMLLSLTRPSRSADLAQLEVGAMHPHPDGVSFTPTHLSKQSRQGRPLQDFFFPSFKQNLLLCPVTTLEAYLERTKNCRGQVTKVLIGTIKPHKAVAPSTIARWLKTMLECAGITQIFLAATP